MIDVAGIQSLAGVVLGHVRQQAEQAVGRKAVSRIPLRKAKAQLVDVTAGFSPASVVVSCGWKE